MKRFGFASNRLPCLVGGICLAFTGLAFALNDDQVRGEIVSVDSDSSEIRLRVLESGDDRPARRGTIETYEVPENTPIEYDIDRSIVFAGDELDLNDLSAGDRVVLDFEDLGTERRRARGVRNEQAGNTEVRRRVERTGRRVEDRLDRGADRFVGVDAARDDNANDRQYVASRNELPDTASALPMMAVFGLAFAGLAGFLGHVRRRNGKTTRS